MIRPLVSLVIVSATGQLQKLMGQLAPRLAARLHKEVGVMYTRILDELRGIPVDPFIPEGVFEEMLFISDAVCGLMFPEFRNSGGRRFLWSTSAWLFC